MSHTGSSVMIFYFLFIALCSQACWADETDSAYLQPPEVIAETLLATPPPEPLFDTQSHQMALLYSESTIAMERIGQDYMGLAGFRFNPVTRRSGIAPLVTKIEIIDTLQQRANLLWLPEQDEARFADVRFSPDGRYLSAQVVSTQATKLALFDTQTGIEKSLNIDINPAWGSPCEWATNRTLLCKAVKHKGHFSSAKLQQPRVMEHFSDSAPVRTYSNLLQSNHDEQAFEHYFSSTLVAVSVTGNSKPINAISGLIADVSPSPDGQYVVIKRIHPPFSHLVRASRFPSTIEVWDLKQPAPLYLSSVAGYNLEKPKGADANNIRTFVWRAGPQPAISWIQKKRNAQGKIRYHWMVKERLDETDDSNGDTAPKTLVVSKKRLRDFGWTTAGTPYYSVRSNSKKQLDYFVLVNQQPRLFASINTLDKYRNPGKAIRLNGDSGAVLEVDGKVFLSGDGLSDDGVIPFLDQVDLASGHVERLFESNKDGFEKVIAIQDVASKTWITALETQNTPPDYYLLKAGQQRRALRLNTTPYPQLDKVERSIIYYQRNDGVKLQATLYRPNDVPKSTPLPTLIWIYPYEYSDEEYAQQANIRWFQFHRIKGASPIAAALAGYAVVMNPSMPIIQADDAINSNYLTELIANAEAVTRYLTDSGISIKDKMAVGGQSYGAFSSANLLIHTDLFATAIVESGAYNRTLTPFGFQREKRSFWDATHFYTQVSPFFHIDKLNKPILLIHGAEDENSGTAPLQSERFFHALVGQGVPARYIELPYEGHHFRGRDTVLHTAAEKIQWLDRTIGKEQPKPAAE